MHKAQFRLLFNSLRTEKPRAARKNPILDATSVNTAHWRVGLRFHLSRAKVKFGSVFKIQIMTKHHMPCAVMKTSQACTISRRRLRRGICLRFAPVALTGCIVSEAVRLFTAANQQRLNPFVRDVHNTDLSNCRIIGNISRPSVQRQF